jgi:hypothetical protein
MQGKDNDVGRVVRRVSNWASGRSHHPDRKNMEYDEYWEFRTMVHGYDFVKSLSETNGAEHESVKNPEEMICIPGSRVYVYVQIV